MATSTRHKIKDQYNMCLKAIANVKYHLMYLGKLAGVESPHINKTLPAVYYAIEQLEEVFKAFRQGL